MPFQYKFSILKIISSLLAFSLGIMSVWVSGGFSYFDFLFEQTPKLSEPTRQISEPPLGSNLQVHEHLPDELEDFFGTPLVWRFLMNDEKYGKLAVVRATGETANGNVRAKLKLNCPGRYSAITIIVGDMESSGFNLHNYSVASDSPVLKKNLVEIRAVSPRGDLSLTTRAEGNIGYDNLYPTVVFFELTKTRKLERLIANGSTEVTFVIHDLGDYQRTIKITFPAISSSSEMVKDLHRNCYRPI